MTLTNIVYKAAGVVGAGVLAYDAHHWGKLKSNEYRSNKEAESCMDFFHNTQYNTNQSHFMSGVKKKLFRWNLGNRIRGDFNSVVGYIKGGVSNLLGNIVPLAASVAAIAGKGTTSKIGAGVLAGWTALSFLRNGCSHLFNNRTT